jgi:hypothetical protein
MRKILYTNCNNILVAQKKVKSKLEKNPTLKNEEIKHNKNCTIDIHIFIIIV